MTKRGGRGDLPVSAERAALGPMAHRPPGFEEGALQLDMLSGPPAAGASPARSRAAPASSLEQHRDRMRERLLTAGPEALTDLDVLEMVLFLALPRIDTKPIAARLLARFGSFAAVIAAPPRATMSVEGMGKAGAAALRIVWAALVHSAK